MGAPLETHKGAGGGSARYSAGGFGGLGGGGLSGFGGGMEHPFSLFDHLVGAGEQRWGKGEAE
jgi:hypothetical protein